MGKDLLKPTSIKDLRKLVRNYRKKIVKLPEPQGNPAFTEQTKYVWISEENLERLLKRCKRQYGAPDGVNREAGIKFYFGCYPKDLAPTPNHQGLLTLASVGSMKIKTSDNKFVYKDAVSRRKPKEEEKPYQVVFDLQEDEGDNHGHMCPPSCDSGGEDDDIFCCLENELGCDPSEDCIETEP